MVKVSIIMPVYNGEDFLENSISSICNQSLKDIELICVNDGSIDGSLDLLNNLAERNDFIRIISQNNQGSGKARNLGIEKASGEYIAFLDADDMFLDSNALEEMFLTAKKFKADMVGANLKRINSDGKILKNPNYKYKTYMYFNEYGEISPNEYGIPWAFYKNIFKREFLLENNIVFPDLKRGQDPVFLAEILTSVDKIYTVPVDFYGYNYNAAGKPETKINNYEKKEDYLIHFKKVFEILEKKGFNNVSHEFKKQLISFLKFSIKNDDNEIFEIFHKVFNKDELIDFTDEIDSFDSNYILKEKENSTSQESFDENKNKLSKLNLYSNYHIPKSLMREIILVFSNDNFENFLTNLYEFKIFDLYVRNEELRKKNKKLTRSNKKLNKKLKNAKKLNKIILNSTSWKLTRPLRKFRKSFEIIF